MAISLWWVCLGQYALYNRKNRVWLNNLSNQERIYTTAIRQYLVKQIAADFEAKSAEEPSGVYSE
jgi:hypothetical protein